MYHWALLLHLLGSMAMGFYLLLPFLLQRMAGRSGPEQAGAAGLLYAANRIGQFLLIAQFLTGGYLLGPGNYSALWIILGIVILVALGAFTGMMGKEMKRLRERLVAGGSAGPETGKIRVFGWLTFVSLLLMIVVMKNPGI